MSAFITIDASVLGRKKPLFADWSIPYPPDLREDGDRLTLRDLISRIVREEVDAFKKRQEDRRLTRVLSRVQIEEGVEKGKIDAGGRELDQKVDEEDAVACALQAFEDGLYLVILDGDEETKLDREIYLKPNSKITFLRLAMLAGG